MSDPWPLKIARTTSVAVGCALLYLGGFGFLSYHGGFGIGRALMLAASVIIPGAFCVHRGLTGEGFFFETIRTGLDAMHSHAKLMNRKEP